MTSLQNTVLNAFTNVLSSSPGSLEIFREEGIWDLIFSENFFYFESTSEHTTGEIFSHNEEKSEVISALNSTRSLQMDVISFLEFAATSNGNAHNLVYHPSFF